MELDQEAYDKIIEIAKDLACIRERLCEGRETFKEHKKTFKGHDERIRILEQNQQLLTGKMTLLIMGVGMVMLFILNLIARLWK